MACNSAPSAPHLITSASARGFSVTEFAVALPIILILLAGIFDVALPLSQNETVTEAVRQVGQTMTERSIRALPTSIEPCANHIGALRSEAQSEFNRFMQDARLDPAKWDFTLNISEQSDGFISRKLLTVTAIPNEQYRCLLCQMGINIRSVVDAEKQYVLLGDCSL